MFRTNWFQNGIVNMAQSMGQTATGLLFVKMVDPKDKTNAMESFGYKQLLFEPFMGGGIVTALSMPAIILLGLPVFTAIAAGICVTWMLLGVFYFGRKY
jgi:ESS family glutamate:Na+ symporter